MKNIRLIFAISLLLPAGTFAQTNWTLKSCIEYGLKNNRSGIVYANEKKAADAKAKEALAAYLPTLDLNAELDDNIKPQTSLIPAGVFSPTDIRVAFTKRYNPTATAELKQTIYDQSLLTGLKANRYNKEQADLNIRQNDEAIIYNISNDYYQIFVYREQLRLQHSDLATYSKQMEIIDLKVKKGVTLQKDLDKVTVDYNNAQSKIRVAESNRILAENQLKYDMGLPLAQPIQIDSTTATPVLPRDYADSGTDTSGFSATNRVDFRLSQVNSKLLEIDEKRIRSTALPTLTAFARYGGVGFGDNLGGAFSGMTDYSLIGLKLSFPIFNFYKRGAQYKQALYKRLNAEENLKLDEGKYRLEYENSKTKLLKQQANMENDQHNITLAQSVFDVTNLQYQKGTTDLTDWLNAQNSLKEAQNNYLQSLYNFILARIDVEKAGGTLKQFYASL